MRGAVSAVLAASLWAAAGVAAETTTVTAIHALHPGGGDRQYDANARAFDELLDSLDYSKFETIARERVTLSPDSTTEIRINDRYTLTFRDTTLEENGLLKSQVHVYGMPKQGTEPVKVVEVTLRLAPEKPVMIRGLRSEDGEIVVVIQRDAA